MKTAESHEETGEPEGTSRKPGYQVADLLICSINWTGREVSAENH